MSLLDRMKRKASSRKVAGRHPLLNMDADRCVRDSYFRGVVLAAYIDDGRVDASERAYLRKVGLGLNLPEADVNEVIAEVGMLKTEEGQMSLVEDVAARLTIPRIAKLFLCEFSFVWMSHAANIELLKSYRSTFAELMKLDVDSVWFDKLDVAISSPGKRAKIASMMRDLGEDGLEYLFCDVAEEVESVQSVPAAEEVRRTLEKSLVEEIEGQKEWPAEFDYDRIRSYFANAGIKEHFVSSLLKMLLPYARVAYEAAKDAIRRDRVHGWRDQMYWSVSLCEIPAVCILFRYVKCMDGSLSISGHTIFKESYRKLYWGWRGNDDTVANNRAIALEEFAEHWDALFREFEYRAAY